MLSTEVEEDGVRGRKHRRAEELMAEATAQYQATAQASKAVRFCEESDEFTGSLEHVEAERLLLVSSEWSFKLMLQGKFKKLRWSYLRRR